MLVGEGAISPLAFVSRTSVQFDADSIVPFVEIVHDSKIAFWGFGTSSDRPIFRIVCSGMNCLVPDLVRFRARQVERGVSTCTMVSPIVTDGSGGDDANNEQL